jgi:phospholipase C
MVTVYQAKVWDYLRDGMRVTRQKGTLAWVSNRQGIVVPETSEDVSPACVDETGCYMGPPEQDNEAEPAAEMIVIRSRRRA